EQLVVGGGPAVGRVHALWTLEGLGKLTAARIERSFIDPEPGVRENVIRLAEPRLKTEPSLVAWLLRMVNDPDPKVRFQLLCTLGDLDTPEARAAREHLLFENIDDEWMQVAALSAVSVPPAPWLAKVLARGADRPLTKEEIAFIRRLGSL